MGALTNHIQIDGGVTPICSACGIALCWDISEDEYLENQDFWDEWTCRDCNPNYKGAYALYKARKIK